MGIRWKAVIAIAVTVAALLSIGFFASDRFLSAGFQDIERESAIEASMQLRRLIDRDLDSMNRLNDDWASWDDSYEFVANPTEAFVDSNLPPSTLVTLERASSAPLLASDRDQFARGIYSRGCRDDSLLE